MNLNADFTAPALVRYRDATWRPSPMVGVERLMLDRVGDEVARATTLVAYAPGSRFSEHIHGGGEEFLVLDGIFSDDSGDFGPGFYIRNPVGSGHAPWSEDGTTIFVKLCQMDPADQANVRIDTANGAWRDGPVDGVMELPLHAFGTERVRLLGFDPGAFLPEQTFPNGAELLVIGGVVETAMGRLEERDWLRVPPGTPLAISSIDGGAVYLKTGHLPPR